MRQKHAEGWTFVTYVHSSRESLLVDVHSVLGQSYVKGYVHTSVCGWYVERGGEGVMGGCAGVEGCVLKAHHSLFDWLRNCVILIHCILSKIKNLDDT